MPLSKYDTPTAREKLEQRIVHGLACEWELALGILTADQHLMGGQTSIIHFSTIINSG